MKKLYIIAAAALTLGATSCDDTLDKQPLDEIVSNTQYWANDDNVQTQIDRFYNDTQVMEMVAVKVNSTLTPSVMTRLITLSLTGLSQTFRLLHHHGLLHGLKSAV